MSESSDDELSRSGRFNKFETENKLRSATPKVEPTIRRKNIASDRLKRLKKHLQEDTKRNATVSNNTKLGTVSYQKHNDRKPNHKYVPHNSAGNNGEPKASTNVPPETTSYRSKQAEIRNRPSVSIDKQTLDKHPNPWSQPIAVVNPNHIISQLATLQAVRQLCSQSVLQTERLQSPPNNGREFERQHSQNSSSSSPQKPIRSYQPETTKGRSEPCNIEIKVNNYIQPFDSNGQSLNNRIVKIRNSVKQSNIETERKPKKSDGGSYWVTTIYDPRSSESSSSRSSGTDHISPLLRKTGTKRKYSAENSEEVTPVKRTSVENKIPFYIPPPRIGSDHSPSTSVWEVDRVNESPNLSIDNTFDSRSCDLNGLSTNNVKTVTVKQEPTCSGYLDEAQYNMDWDSVGSAEETVSSPEQKSIKPEGELKKSQDLCVVIDTNVFIQALPKIRELVELEIEGEKQLVLLIPWMVTQELDNLKDTCFTQILKRNTTNAIKFLNKLLESRNPRIRGQTHAEMAQQKVIGLSQDDKIIACCEQATENYETVILLSADTSLKNKALINKIEVSSNEDIVKKVMLALGKNVKMCKILRKMSTMCSYVICECAKEAYGKVWNQMDLLAEPPWSLAECLQRFKKYWVAVFKDQVMKQCIKTVEYLLSFLALNKCVQDDSQAYQKFVKLCIDLCIFLKDIHECRGTVQTTLNEITHMS